MNLQHPALRHRIVLDPLPESSTAGLPLANGLLGALVWRRGEDLLVSLDRADLWDLRPVPEYLAPDYRYGRLAELVEADEMDAVRAMIEAPYSRAAPNKLPAGRLRLTGRAGRGELDPAQAMGRVTGSAGAIALFVDATAELGFLQGDGPAPAIVLEAPAFGTPPPDHREPHPICPFGPEDLGYPPPGPVATPDESGYVQALPDGRAFCALVRWTEGERWTAAWTVAIEASPAQALDHARALLTTALADPDAHRTRHAEWWAAYWDKAWLGVPDPVIERQWTLDAYKLGASARAGRPPVSLQAQWTADNGLLPPWKGDYHHDLNTQMTYWPCLTGNRLDAHLGFLDWLWETRPACRDWTRRFYGVEGLNVPMTADIGNRQLGGWAPYTHSATTGAWLAHHFAEHWRMSGDESFLRDRAWSYIRECAVFLDELTRRDAIDGRRRLRLSSSPEIGDNRREAWFPDWTNYDLMLTRTLFAYAAAMAERLGETAEATRWRSAHAELPEPALDETGAFAVAPAAPFAVSHRHFSHQLLMHPLGGVAPGNPRLAATIAGIDEAGTAAWMGYSFAWSACLHALAGDGARAAERLRQFASGFTAPNSFHTNGEVGPDRLTMFQFDVFTLEGNCAAMAAAQDMLLQSRGDLIDLFPAIPADWSEARFAGFLAEGGVAVDATLHPDRIEAELRAAYPSSRRVRGLRGSDRPIMLRPNEPSRVVLPRP